MQNCRCPLTAISNSNTKLQNYTATQNCKTKLQVPAGRAAVLVSHLWVTRAILGEALSLLHDPLAVEAHGLVVEVAAAAAAVGAAVAASAASAAAAVAVAATAER